MAVAVPSEEADLDGVVLLLSIVPGGVLTLALFLELSSSMSSPATFLVAPLMR